MQISRFVNAAVLSVLVGGAALVYAQDAKPEDKPAHAEESKPAQDEARPQPKQDEARPEGKQEEARPAHQEEMKPSKEDKKAQKDEEKQQKNDMRENSRQPAMQDQEHGHPAAVQGHPAGRGGHIPDDKFHSHFGRSHTFRAQTVVVRGQPQFQYGGYTFELVDAWPADWAYTDDCYIDYIDGEYYLIDLLHPDVRLAVFVVL
jgi:hypothetical protein